MYIYNNIFFIFFKKTNKAKNFGEYIKKGFTLAEIISVVAILGIVAALIIPSTMKRNIEKTNRVKVKKALAVYDTLINKLVIEQDIRSKKRLDDFAVKDNCTALRNYFKVSQVGESNCLFRTSDGVWWDFEINGRLSKPIIALKRKNLENKNASMDDDFSAFFFVTDFDNKGSLRISDPTFGYDGIERDYDDISIDYIVSTAKLWAYLNNNDIMNYYKLCTNKMDNGPCVKIDENNNLGFYDTNKKKKIFLHNCKSPGYACSESRKDKTIESETERINIRTVCGYQGAKCTNTVIYAGPQNSSDEEKQNFTNLITHLRPDFQFDKDTLTYEKTYKCKTVTKTYNDNSCEHVGYYLHVLDNNGKVHSLEGSKPACYENPTNGCKYRDYYDWQWLEWK